MKSLIRLAMLVVATFSFSACTQKEKKPVRAIASIAAEAPMEGIWFLQGTSSTRGPYNGELELRKASDGTFDVRRVVTYINYFFDGLRVQEVWIGKAVAHSGSLTVSYELLQGDFITRLGDLKRQPSEFKNPMTIVSRFQPEKAHIAAQFVDLANTTYSEWLTTRRDLQEKPMWIDERRKIEAQGPAIPNQVRQSIRKFKAETKFDSHALVKLQKERTEFRQEKPYIVLDGSDYDFYRENKNTIRVVNKLVDKISATEAVVKRNAYSPTLAEKAEAFDQNAMSKHLNELGLLVDARLTVDGQVQEYVPGESSVLDTGMYISSQAMRFLVTKDSKALKNIRRAVKGLALAIEVSAATGKSVNALQSDQRELPQGWQKFTEASKAIQWQEGDERSFVLGSVQGLMWASLAVPQTDAATIGVLKSSALRLLEASIKEPKYKNKVLGIAALLTNERSLKDRYLEGVSLAGTSASSEKNFYWNGAADWDRAHFSALEMATEIQLADLLGHLPLRDQYRKQLIENWVIYSPAQRHLLTLLTYQFASRTELNKPGFLQGRDHLRFTEAVANSVWSLREMPYPRPNLDVSIDHSMTSEWALSPIPANFWQKRPQRSMASLESLQQGLYRYPAFELQSFSHLPAWREPVFSFRLNRSEGVQSSGVDYLYTYWLARYAGIQGVD